MIGYVVRRVLRAITTLLGTTLIIFVLVRVVPADPAVTIAGPKADPETLAAIRKDLGLDDPVVVQYGRYLAGLARGDLGRSYMTGRRVADVIAERLPATAWLALTSLALGFSLGLVLGIVTAARRGSLIDVAVLLGTLIGLSIPTFWLGNLLIYEFSYRLKLLPLGGYGSGGAWWRPNPLNLVLPAITLAIVEFFFYARFVHTNVGGTLASDYIRTARAKGAPPARLYFVHALRNALIPIVTVVSLDFAAILGGAVVTERVFGWQGMGSMIVDGVNNVDVNVVLAWLMVTAVVVVLFNLVTDIVYGIIDPRIRYG